MQNKHSESSAVHALSQKHDIAINGYAICLWYGPKTKGDAGIKSKGKISFLVNHCGYRVFEEKRK